MFLGPINVRATRKDVKLKVKEEYNNFRVCIYLLFMQLCYNMFSIVIWVNRLLLNCTVALENLSLLLLVHV